MFFKQFGHCKGDFGGDNRAFFDLDIAASLEGGDGWGVGGWTTYPLGFQLLDETGFAKT
jgi:hypothetical protein